MFLDLSFLNRFRYACFKWKIAQEHKTVPSMRIDSFFQFRFSYLWTLNTFRSFAKYLAVKRYYSWHHSKSHFSPFLVISIFISLYITFIGLYWTHYTPYTKPKYMPNMSSNLQIIKEKTPIYGTRNGGKKKKR